MAITAQEVAALAKELGSAEGLERVTEKIELLNARLAEGGLPCSRDDLPALSDAIASLSQAIMRMNQVAHQMLAEAGGSTSYVG